MKKKTSSVLSIAIALFVFFSTNTFAQNGQVRNVASFDELNLSISGDVYLKQGSTQKVEIEASDKLLEKIDTEVKGSALNIKWNEKNVRHSEKIKIYITMTKVNALRIAGSGDIMADGLISTDKLELKISGSGDIKLADVKANDISSKISGSADISIKGSSTVNSLIVGISGSGDVNAVDLPVNEVEVAIAGSGDCKVYAKERLKAKVAGSGDVYYKGNAVIDSKVAGSGSVKHIN
jgi:hypothetical protein